MIDGDYMMSIKKIEKIINKEKEEMSLIKNRVAGIESDRNNRCDE